MAMIRITKYNMFPNVSQVSQILLGAPLWWGKSAFPQKLARVPTRLRPSRPIQEWVFHQTQTGIENSRSRAIAPAIKRWFKIPIQSVKRHSTEETISMKRPFRISHRGGCGQDLIDPFLSDDPSWDKGWSGYLAGKNSTQGGDR